ncbi:uncharacterized protein LOC123559257 [Mercenaria mercenaria]|uniref:uncharacterized protein LOC123559257 n=1 Tax=Mercenaria mercenaria TaxID=6596 RepID=UPI00234F02D1|nr:uncharacterized protein LOC123559257 [Mercenaria mercenaria]
MMQLPGHTRCLIDARFGRIKQLYRRSDVDTVDHAGDVVNRSSHSNEAVMYGNANWTWRQWKVFLADRFKKVPNIAKYHSFRFTADEPGVVYMKVSSTDEAEVRFVVCKTHLLEMDPSSIPPELSAGGLSSERHRYLYRHVRPLVRQPNRDCFCLPPTAME